MKARLMTSLDDGVGNLLTNGGLLHVCVNGKQENAISPQVGRKNSWKQHSLALAMLFDGKAESSHHPFIICQGNHPVPCRVCAVKTTPDVKPHFVLQVERVNQLPVCCAHKKYVGTSW